MQHNRKRMKSTPSVFFIKKPHFVASRLSFAPNYVQIRDSQFLIFNF